MPPDQYCQVPVRAVLALVLAAACVSEAVADRDAPEASVRSGRLAGKWLLSRQGRDIAAFEGIPYAAPPVGELRFQAPRPAESWTAVRRATEPGAMCTQRNLFIGETGLVGEEDCLYLNVYAPEAVTREVPLPVLFYIHGGGWTSGSGHDQQPDYLLDHDVILVTINYRLGPLGFLSTQDDVIPGNHGLKDQVQALRWVRDNIAAFGGDPESVTIAGESAGGTSVHMLVLSPLAKGLFHRAIPMSGNALLDFAVSPPGEASRHAARLAELLQCPTAPSKALRDCLLTKSHQDIIATDQAFPEWGMHPLVPFKSVAEPSGPEAFIDRHPRDILLAGDFNDVPLMTGVTSHEGCLFAVALHENDAVLREFDERFSSVLPLVLLKHHLPKAVIDGAAKQVRKFYYGDGPITHDSKESTIKMLSDSVFVWPTIQIVQLHVKHGKSPVYFYEFAYQSRRSFSQVLGSKGADYGVCHADDLLYLFPMTVFFPNMKLETEEDVAMSKKHVEIFVNFTKTGRPSESWQRVEHPEEAEYLHIGTHIAMRAGYAKERIGFWEKLPLGQPQSQREEL